MLRGQRRRKRTGAGTGGATRTLASTAAPTRFREPTTREGWTSTGVWLLLVLAATVFGTGEVRAQIKAAADLTDEDCALCHDGSEPEIPAATPEDLTHSIHDGFACLDCHADIEEIPHADVLAPADCASCHDDAAEAYTHHGLGEVGVTPDLPTCGNCHGSHDIRAVDDPESRSHASRMGQTCGRCHSDLNFAREHDIGLKRVVEMYEVSVHGMARSAGDDHAAICTDCHGSDGDPHRILGAGNVESAVNHFNIPSTCGQCHGEVEEQYWIGIHGKLTARGDTHLPVCTDCHGEHGILPPDDPRSNVSSVRVAEATCTPCHQSARISEAYNLPAGKKLDYVDTFHGTKSRAGDVTVANCASCHDAHAALPSSDPRSRVYPGNLQATCGECHPGISAAVAQVPIHAPRGESAWAQFFRQIYILLIAVVIGGMLLFVVLDFRKRSLEQRELPQVTRMDRNAILQHMVLFISFTVLVLTGFALRYSDFWLYQILFGWDGGFGARGTIHRVAAVIFVIGSAWHVFYLRTPSGRQFLRDMLPGLHDAREVRHAFGYNLGLSRQRPRAGRFGFAEKAEYWALVWGTVIMGATGFLLWFRNEAVESFSREFVAVMRVIHLYEAWLATLAILVWHFYGVIFKPGVYPGNPSWITGKMPREMYEEEHPDAMDEVEESSAVSGSKRDA